MRRKNKSKKISFDPETNNEQLKVKVQVSVNRRKENSGIEEQSIKKEPSYDKRTQKHSHSAEKVIEVDEIEASRIVTNDSGPKKDGSKRSKKRKKHMELLEEKKIKVDVTHQERSLNYLSKWKHSPKDWKFEKNRQAWLKQNMFNVDKVPDQFWDILVEYFSNAKGNIRKMMVADALKVIEAHENIDNVIEGDTSSDVVINRARAIIQSLEE